DSGGTLAVITVADNVDAVHAMLRDEFDVGFGADGLTAPITVLSPRDAKGLEFDGVVVVEPSAIVAESARGASSLFVALTRPTQRLTIVTEGELPPGLDALRAAASAASAR